QEMMRPPMIAQTFSYEEIRDKLKKAFIYRGLKDTKFEFCIFSEIGVNTTMGSNTFELKSPNFFSAFTDTINNKQTMLPLVTSSSELTGPEPFETLWIIIPDYKSVVMKQMRLMIFGM